MSKLWKSSEMLSSVLKPPHFVFQYAWKVGKLSYTMIQNLIREPGNAQTPENYSLKKAIR